MIKISIIVPIYNVENYLRKCLDSLVNQTIDEKEIILVNDASPDRCDLIMDEYDKKYDFIKTIYLEESRCAGGARNAGVQVATGQYISFVDSDDYLDLDYFEKLIAELEKTDSDFAYSGHKSVDENGVVKSEGIIYPIEFSGELTLNKKKGMITKGVYPWAKVFKRDLWNSIELTFPEYLKYEDAATIPIYVVHSKKCCYVSGVYYYYCLSRNTSILRTRNAGHADSQKTALIFEERMKKYNLLDEYKDEVEFFIINRYYNTFLRRAILMYDKPQLEQMTNAYNYIRNRYGNYEKNKYYYIISAEARYRMKLNELSSSVCAQWELLGGSKFNLENGIYKEMYKPFYYEHKEKIISIINEKNVLLYGEPTKKIAFEEFLNEIGFSSNIVSISTTEELKEWFDKDNYIIIGVSPKSCYPIKKYIQNHGENTLLINLEDYLHHFLTMEDF